MKKLVNANFSIVTAGYTSYAAGTCQQDASAAITMDKKHISATECNQAL
jgi:hypothetical protein